MTETELRLIENQNQHGNHSLFELPDISGQIEREQEIRRKVLQGVSLACLALVANLVVLALVAVFKDALLAAKVLLLELMLSLAVVCLAVACFSAQILDLLEKAEQIAYILRDEAMFELQHQQLILRNISERLAGGENPVPDAHISDLLKFAGPLAMMFFQKEKSIVKWGMMGMQIAKNALKMWKNRG